MEKSEAPYFLHKLQEDCSEGGPIHGWKLGDYCFVPEGGPCTFG